MMTGEEMTGEMIEVEKSAVVMTTEREGSPEVTVGIDKVNLANFFSFWVEFLIFWYKILKSNIKNLYKFLST